MALVGCWLALSGPAALSQNIRTATIRVALVVDFVNRAGSVGAGLDRFATDAVAVDLAKSGRYEILKRAEVDRTARELNLRSPWDKLDLERLAQALGADAIVTGEISFVRREWVKEAERVTVGMRIRVFDPETGELLAGASPIASREGPRK